MANYTTRMSFFVPRETKARWKAIAKAQTLSLSELIRRATSAYRLGVDEGKQ